jgi:hypothetical protein
MMMIPPTERKLDELRAEAQNHIEIGRMHDDKAKVNRGLNLLAWIQEWDMRGDNGPKAKN